MTTLCLFQLTRRQLPSSVAANVALEQEPAAICGQQPTRLPWLRQPPVFRWILPVLSGSIPLRHLLLGGAE